LYGGCAIPVKVKGVGGSGSLTGVVAVRGASGTVTSAPSSHRVGWTAGATAKTANSATGWPATPTSR